MDYSIPTRQNHSNSYYMVGDGQVDNTFGRSSTWIPYEPAGFSFRLALALRMAWLNSPP